MPSTIQQPQTKPDREVTQFAGPSDGGFKIDERNRYVYPVSITNGSEDRSGEIIDPNGIITTAYEQNPMIYFVHSHKINPLIPTVGQAITPDGKFACFRKGDVWYSGCKFNTSTKFAEQVFAMVAEKSVRGRSIGAIAHKYEPYRPTLPGMVFHQGEIKPARSRSVICKSAELFEWSWTPIPCNRDMVDMGSVEALKSILSRGRIDSQNLDPMLGSVLKSIGLDEMDQIFGWNHTKGGDPLWQSLKTDSSLSSHKRGLLGKSHNTSGATTSEASGTGARSMKNRSVVPLAVLFDKGTTPAKAKQFLKDSAGVLDSTDIVLDPMTNCLKSIQVAYDGETRTIRNQQFPGVSFIVAKGMEDGMMDESDPEVPSVRSDRETVVVDPQAPVIKAKPGARWVQGMVDGLVNLKAMAEAALEDVEHPMITEEATKTFGILNDLTSVLNDLSGKAYPKPAAVEGETEEVEEESETPAELAPETLKSMFYRDRVFVPAPIARAVAAVANAKGERAVQSARQFLENSMLKGFLPQVEDEPQTVTKSATTSLDEIQARMAMDRLNRAAAKAELQKNA